MRSFGAYTVELHARPQIAGGLGSSGVLRHGVAGVHQLSGDQTDQLTGNQVLLLRLGCYRRLRRTTALTRGLFVGGTREAGNA